MKNQLVALTEDHYLDSFECGVPALNEWLQNIAGQHQKKLISRTFVLPSDNSPTIIGFYTLAIRGLISTADLPPAFAKRLPLNVPALTLARLAISSGHQRQGIGELLLVDAMTRARNTALQTGGVFLFVDAKDAKAAAFYRKYDFIAFPDNPLMLAMKVIDIPADFGST